MINKDQFNLDFGTKVSHPKLETIEVTINPDFILKDFALAYRNELHRRNPVRFEAIGLTEDELKKYFTGLLAIRVQSLSAEGCKDWRKAKALFIPSWVEFSLSMIGEVVDSKRGLKFTPVMQDCDYDLSEMLGTSDKLQSFIADGVVLHRDAFPRSSEGDYETMSMAIIDGYVQSIDDKSHPIASYIAAFLGFTLKKETDFKMLYRIRYDDVEYIRTMLLAEETIR